MHDVINPPCRDVFRHPIINKIEKDKEGRGLTALFCKKQQQQTTTTNNNYFWVLQLFIFFKFFCTSMKCLRYLLITFHYLLFLHSFLHFHIERNLFIAAYLFLPIFSFLILSIYNNSVTFSHKYNENHPTHPQQH